MRLAATTVIRHVPPGTCSGRLLILDVTDDAVTVSREIRLPESRFRAVDPNARGGTRGLRGVAVGDNQLLVTDSTGINLVDPGSGAVTGRVEHPLMGGVHAVVEVPGGLCVTAAHSDTVLAVDGAGAELWRWRPTDCAALQAQLPMPHPIPPDLLGDFRDPSLVARHVHDVTHVNAVARRGDELVISLGSVLTRDPRGAIPGTGADQVPFRRDVWRPPPGRWRSAHVIVRIGLAELAAGRSVPEVLWVGPAAHFPNHDLVPGESGIWFNDSNTCQVCRVELGRITSRIPVSGQFLRGMTPSGAGHIMVGTQDPLQVHAVDPDRNRIVRSWRVPGSAHESFTWLTTYPEPGGGLLT